MEVLVYFEGLQQSTAQRTVARLAEQFDFNVDLLADATTILREAWQAAVRGTVREVRVDGPFEQAVARACDLKRYDLVVAAPQDRRGLLRVLLGSRIGRFVGAAPATIWVPRDNGVRLARIVVGLSGGPQSEQDARLAARLAMAYNAKLELVLVVSQLPLFFTSFVEFQSAVENDATLASMAPGVVELRRIAALLQESGVQADMVVRFGTVADELVEVCAGLNGQPPADLLVIGAHAPSLYAGGDYLENLAEEIVVSAPCATLVVHAKSEWAEWTRLQRNAD